METKTKRKYVAPAVLEDLRLEMEAQILQSSEEVELEIETVDTVGQQSYDISKDSFTHEWK